MIFSADETTDVGRDTGTPVAKDYTRLTSHFTGKVNWVRIDLGKDDQGHSVTPEQRLNLEMARQ
jgi:arylsulfatase